MFQSLFVILFISNSIQYKSYMNSIKVKHMINSKFMYIVIILNKFSDSII